MTESSTTLPTNFGSLWVNTILASFLGRTDELGELDRKSGDGDFGNNIAGALRRAEAEIAKNQPNSYAEWMTAVSRGFLGTGGTSGPLFGMFFRDVARSSSATGPTVDELAAGLSNGLATVQRYGKAELGHKTMVDAIAPAAEALRKEVDRGAGAAQALETAATAAIGGAKSTRDIVARRGRASYVGETSLGVLDPGATAVAMIIQSAASAMSGTVAPVETSWMTS